MPSWYLWMTFMIPWFSSFLFFSFTHTFRVCSPSLSSSSSSSSAHALLSSPIPTWFSFCLFFRSWVHEWTIRIYFVSFESRFFSWPLGFDYIYIWFDLIWFDLIWYLRDIWEVLSLIYIPKRRITTIMIISPSSPSFCFSFFPLSDSTQISFSLLSSFSPFQFHSNSLISLSLFSLFLFFFVFLFLRWRHDVRMNECTFFFSMMWAKM